jgi:nitrite reductase (NO-forming)
VSLAFAVAAIVTTLVPHDTGAWLPLHLFLVGSVTMAIAVVTVMLAVTWSGSPAPPRSTLVPQRWTLAIGAALVAIGHTASTPSATVVGGVLAAGSLTAVAAMLLQTRRAARTPRFDPAIDAYVLAITAALTGMALGIGFTTGSVSAAMRDSHVIVNLFAFVGVVVAGTLPYFTATQARTKMAPRARPAAMRTVAVGLWATATAGAAAAAFGHDRLAASALLAYGVGVLTIVAVLPRVGAKQIGWAGPRLLQLFAGVAWWSGATCWLAVTRWSSSTIDGVALRTLVIGGFAQILTASLAYLVPVVRGGGHVRLGAGFRRTRSWVGLAAGNAAALLTALDERPLLVVALGVWAVDLAARVVTHHATN